MPVLLLLKHSVAQSNVTYSPTDEQNIVSSDRLNKDSIPPQPIAQSIITFDASQVFSTFKYIDSQGNKLKDLERNVTTATSVGYHYLLPNGLFIRVNTGTRKAGASFVYNETIVSWDVQYMDANVGLGYIHNKWKFKPYFSASPYFAYMLKANQTIGFDNYDIKKDKSVSTSDFGIFLSPGVRMALAKRISLYAEYKYILGLQDIEKSATETLFNRGFSFHLGLSLAI